MLFYKELITAAFNSFKKCFLEFQNLHKLAGDEHCIFQFEFKLITFP